MALLAGLHGCGVFSLLDEEHVDGQAMALMAGSDLTITAVQGPRSVNPWTSFDVLVTVCNLGDTQFYGADIDVVLSTDEDFDAADTVVGTATPGYVAPGACRDALVMASANNMEGVYFLGAIADPQNQGVEADESNNTAAGGAIGVGYEADLRIEAFSAPPSGQPPTPIEVALTVCNRGQSSSMGTSVAVMRSDDADITGADDAMGSVPIDDLEPGQCVNAVTQVTVNGPQGSYYLGALVDPWDGVIEIDDDNNGSAAVPYIVGWEPNLVIASVSAPDNVAPGSNFTAMATVCNQGTMPSSFVDVEIYLSSDPALDPLDINIGMSSAPYLEAGQCAEVLINCYTSEPDDVYFLIANVDANDSVIELDETDNTYTGLAMGVGFPPDLVVSSVSGPASATPGSSFTAQVKVCNQGLGTSPSSNVGLYLSPDTSITIDDAALGGAPLDSLQPGACATIAVTGQANDEGYGYLGAFVDGDDTIMESNESNNGGAGGLFASGYGPDLVVASVAGPASVEQSMSFDATVTVCNQGTDPSQSSNVELFLSGEHGVGVDDYMLGTAPVGDLQAGQCTAVAVTASGSPLAGTYWLGARASSYESELIYSNNGTAGGMIAIGLGPDLVVTSVSGPASVTPSGSFAAEVRVCNQGTDMSTGTDVDIVLSGDGVITADDVLLGGAPVPDLQAGQCTSVTAQATTSEPDGLYYLGAIVDGYDYVAELVETNNTAAGTVTAVGYGPDFVVTSVSGPASVEAQSGFEASVTVCNQGTDMGPGSPSVGIVLSTDAVVDMGDALLGGAPVSGLQAGQCETVTVPAAASVSDGIYYLGALVDGSDGVAELREDNNSKAGAVMAVGFGPDLIVASVSGPASVAAQSGFEASVTVCNQGTAMGTATSVDIVLSADPTIEESDGLLGGAPVSSLQAGQCETVTVWAMANVDDGTYYLGAIVDGTGGIPELREDNNGEADALVGVGYAPDLFVTNVSGPASVAAQSGFEASVTVCNQGTAMSPGTNVDVVLSADTVMEESDGLLGGFSVPGLQAGQCETVTVMAMANVDDGIYYLGALVDGGDGVAELREDNNSTAGALTAVGNGPDLVVTDTSGPASVQPQTGFEVMVTVCNRGTDMSPGSSVDVVLSADTVIEESDGPIGGAPVSNLQAGQCETVTVQAMGSDGGLYYLGALVDMHDYTTELVESNNTMAGGVVVVGTGPDLIVTSVSGPPAASHGELVSIDFTVCNQGTDASMPTYVDAMLSVDAVVDDSDELLGGAPVSGLQAGQCEIVTGQFNPFVGDGLYMLGARVNFYQYTAELREDNNTYAGEPMAVGNGPDLIVADVSGPASVEPWASFSADVTVCNQGTDMSMSTNVDIVLSADTVIAESDGLLGGQTVSSLQAGQCETVSVMGMANVNDGSYYMGAIVDGGQGVAELREDNNTHAAALTAVGYGPDLVVMDVSGPASVEPWASFSADVTVCNQGTDMSPGTNVDIVLSADTVIEESDGLLGGSSLSSLQAGQCETVSVVGMANVNDGSYTLGAIVDGAGSVVELREDNNAAAGGVVIVGFAPDLIVTSVSGPASTWVWTSVDVSVEVCNQGTDMSMGTNIDVVLSTDSAIDLVNDQIAGGGPVGNLQAGACTSVIVSASSSIEGSFVLGAVVDGADTVSELIEDNNVAAGNSIDIVP